MIKRHEDAINNGKKYNHGYVFIDTTVYYAEYGSGAEIISENGYVVADFPNHLDAEKFLDLLDKKL